MMCQDEMPFSLRAFMRMLVFIMEHFMKSGEFDVGVMGYDCGLL